MADPNVAERSSIEIRSLLHKLHPKVKDGGHKERVRRLARFRNFVTGSRNKTTPEFYDDDLALLFMGSKAPSAILDEELVGLNLYGLLEACGTPSEDHAGELKRSAKNAMTLVKYLVIDHVDYTDGKPLTDPNKEPRELNGFAVALCSCSATHLQSARFELHLAGDKRGGAPEDACQVIVLLLTQHLAEDGDTPQPLALEALLPSPQSRQVFSQWLSSHASRSDQQAVRAALAAVPKKQKSPSKENKDDDNEEDDANNLFKSKKPRPRTQEAIAQSEKRDLALETMGYDLLQLDVSESNRITSGPATRWEDSKVYRAQQARKNAAEKEGSDFQTLRELEEAAAEQARVEEEKKRMHSRDPLGIRKDEFDLRKVQAKRVKLLEQAVKDLEEQMQEEENLEEQSNETAQHLTNLASQKESLEALLDALTGLDHQKQTSAEDGKPTQNTTSNGSVLPTDPNFDPLLFLTLVHRNATFSQLTKGIDRLSNKTDDQALQLQKLVRDNFDLFIRCADGVDCFNERSGGKEKAMTPRLNDLEALAESCSEQARKSFKPLLDNTNEVRKVKTALTVLNRVTPILQAPALMRHHLDNARFSQAIKEYRRVLVIDDSCNIDLLNHVKAKAEDAARDARRALETRLSKENASLNSLLDGIRDLRELLELDVPPDPDEGVHSPKMNGDAGENGPPRGPGVFDVGGTVINFREHTPAMSCMLLQAAHFGVLVNTTIEQTERSTELIAEGESLSNLQAEGSAGRMLSPEKSAEPNKTNGVSSNNSKGAGNQWKYDVLDARVIATIRAVDVVRAWLPRILRIGVAAHEDEKRRAARVGGLRKASTDTVNELTAFEVVITNLTPSLSLLVEHAAFCALGLTSRASGAEVKMTFGKRAPEKLRNLLRSPLPPSQSAKCAKELADLVEVIVNGSATTNGFRPSDRASSGFSRLSPLDETKVLAQESVIAVERRSCIYAFDVCARSCSARASGSGKFDGEALLQCLQSLSEDLARPEECSSEVEKGCELVVRRICEGLAGYVRDRGDSARLRAVAECADAFDTIVDAVREVGYLTGGRVDAVEEVMMEDILGLEGAMFDEFLDNIRINVDACTRVGWLDAEDGSKSGERDAGKQSNFPPYLSASLLAIVRCRAQVEKALGDKIRRSEGVSYQFLALSTAADGVVEGICAEVKERKQKMKKRQADRMANELQFLMNTLKNYLTDETLAVVDTTRRLLCSKAGRGGGGPDGLAALEELERLGRVYVLCLGDT